MTITLTNEEAWEYIDLKANNDELSKSNIDLGFKVASLTNETTRLKAVLEATERIVLIQDNASSIPVGDSSRVVRDSALAKDLGAEWMPKSPVTLKKAVHIMNSLEAEPPPWIKPKEPVLKKGPYWTNDQRETFKKYITKTGIYSDEKYRTVSWLANEFNCSESAITNRVYTTFSGSRRVIKGKIVPKFNGVQNG